MGNRPNMQVKTEQLIQTLSNNSLGEFQFYNLINDIRSQSRAIFTSCPWPLFKVKASPTFPADIAIEGVFHNPSLDPSVSQFEIINDLGHLAPLVDLRCFTFGTERRSSFYYDGLVD